MAAHSTFITKCRDLSSQVALDLECASRGDECTTRHLEFSELFMQRLLSTTRPETILRQILNADDFDISTQDVCYHALHVEEVSQEIVSLAIATGNARGLYNQYISGIDNHRHSELRAEDLEHDATFRGMRRLRMAEASSQQFFITPQYPFFASYAMDIALATVGTLDRILAGMSVVEIHACSPWLAKNGMPIFSPERQNSYANFPYYFLNHCEDQELKPTFDLLSRLHGEMTAQE